MIRIFTGIALADYLVIFKPSDVDVTILDINDTDPKHVKNACPLPDGDEVEEVLFVDLMPIDGGNLQFHFDQPHKNKGP